MKVVLNQAEMREALVEAVNKKTQWLYVYELDDCNFRLIEIESQDEIMLDNICLEFHAERTQ